MPGEHALLSPSSSHRWMNCTPSARLGENEPESTSDFAEEGTLAHAMCARRLRLLLGEPTADEDAEIAALGPKYHSEEMEEHADVFAALVTGRWREARAATPDARLMVERRLDFGKWVQDAFGTADALILTDGTMEVIDFKYGKGVRVNAFKNPQIMIYALGALDEFDTEYDIEKVRMTIVQPRLFNTTDYVMTAAALRQWGAGELARAARTAYDGEGERKAGPWCRFCPVRPRCSTLRDDALAMTRTQPGLLTPADMAALLPMIPVIKSWTTDAEEYAMEMATKGEGIPGYKLVKGRSVRKVTDPKAAAEALAGAGYTPEEVCKPSELRTFGELEKLVGRKKLGEIIGPWVTKVNQRSTLAPDDDPRPGVGSAADDFAEIPPDG